MQTRYGGMFEVLDSLINEFKFRSGLINDDFNLKKWSLKDVMDIINNEKRLRLIETDAYNNRFCIYQDIFLEIEIKMPIDVYKRAFSKVCTHTFFKELSELDENSFKEKVNFLDDKYYLARFNINGLLAPALKAWYKHKNLNKVPIIAGIIDGYVYVLLENEGSNIVYHLLGGDALYEEAKEVDYQMDLYDEFFDFINNSNREFWKELSI
ncbi:hypothetical protein [Anaerococcus urinomassiliensis]|uniref:hypothetical protein n=1 Tax=Anaerococcus urinomassiliensis TaxID=1745712 RepID=UPI00116119AE|nr:hypothetical protein [Anaerococcus urinomassiliensis]